MMADIPFEALEEQVKNLSTLQKIKLVEAVMATIKEDFIEIQPADKRTLWYGMCADLGNAPSAEEIDEARRETWGNFPLI